MNNKGTLNLNLYLTETQCDRQVNVKQILQNKTLNPLIRYSNYCIKHGKQHDLIEIKNMTDGFMFDMPPKFSIFLAERLKLDLILFVIEQNRF